MCVCVRACMRACVHACVHACVCACGESGVVEAEVGLSVALPLLMLCRGQLGREGGAWREGEREEEQGGRERERGGAGREGERERRWREGERERGGAGRAGGR